MAGTARRFRSGGGMIAVDTAGAATEMLLEMRPLVRGENGDYESWRYAPDGPPEPVAEGSGR